MNQDTSYMFVNNERIVQNAATAYRQWCTLLKNTRIPGQNPEVCVQLFPW